MKSGMCRIKDRIHAQPEATNKRVSVTTVMYAKGCFIAKYRSPLIKARCRSEASHRELTATLRSNIRGHDFKPIVPSIKNFIINKMKAG